MLEKKLLSCGSCGKQQMGVPGHHCRFCGSSRLEPSLIFQGRQETRSGRAMRLFLTGQGINLKTFRSIYNNTIQAGHSGTGLVKVVTSTLRSWMNGRSSPTRGEAIYVAELVKARGYPVYECPFFHPHAAMRAYRIQYYTYWKANRSWFRNHPGIDPGPWWESFRPKESQVERPTAAPN